MDDFKAQDLRKFLAATQPLQCNNKSFSTKGLKGRPLAGEEPPWEGVCLLPEVTTIVSAATRRERLAWDPQPFSVRGAVVQMLRGDRNRVFPKSRIREEDPPE